MHYELFSKNFEPSERAKEKIARLAAKLERRLKTFHPESATLHCSLEKLSSNKSFRVSLTLQMITDLINAREQDENLLTAIRSAFDDLEEQVEKQKSQIRKESEWRRRARRGTKTSGGAV